MNIQEYVYGKTAQIRVISNVKFASFKVGIATYA